MLGFREMKNTIKIFKVKNSLNNENIVKNKRENTKCVIHCLDNWRSLPEHPIYPK